MNGISTSQIFWSPPPGALGRGQKIEYHSISITKSIPKIFKPNFVCLLINIFYKTFIQSPRLYPKGGTWGRGGGGGGGWVKKFNFLTMVMWHIKLKGMIIRPGYTENITLGSNW